MGKPRRPAPVVGKRKGVSGSGGGGSMKRKVGAGAKHAAVNKAKGKATKPVRPPSYVENREEEYEVGEEDLAFFDEHAGFAAGFLKSKPLGKDEAGKGKALRQPQQSLAPLPSPAAAPKRKQAASEGDGAGEKKKKTKRSRQEEDEQSASSLAAAEAAPVGQQEKQEEEGGGKKPRGRKPSTQGWGGAEGGPVIVKERLPIKTVDGKLHLRTEEVPLPVADEEEEEKEEEEEGGQDVEEGSEESEEDEAGGDSDSDVSASEVLSRGRMSLATSTARGSEMAGRYSAAAEGLSLRAFGGDARALRRARLELKKVEIATLCEAVLEDPEAGFMAKVTSFSSQELQEGGKKGKGGGQGRTRIAALLRMLEDEDVRVQGLATLSLLAVFRDVLPAYRIRLPTEKELQTKVSKEVQRTRNYERSLLGGYQAFLKHLEAACKRAGLMAPTSASLKTKQQQQQGATAGALVAARSLCELLTSLPHFNFTTNVLAAVVRLGLGPDAPVRADAARAVRRLLERDRQGEVSLTAAKLVAQEVSNRQLMCPDDVVRALQSLKLRVTEDEAEELLAKRGKGRRGGHHHHKKRKGEEEDEEGEEGGVRADVLAGMKEAEARADPELRARCQAEALQEVTVLYFRVLKHTPEQQPSKGSRGRGKGAKGPTPLLPAALEGLSKVAHLVNSDTVVDLMDVIKDLLQLAFSAEEEQGQRLPPQAALHAVLTALRTLQGPGRELRVDDKAFITFLYQHLRRLRADMVVTAGVRSDSSGDNGNGNGGILPLLAACLRAALVERREFSLARVAAFYKQLTALALQLPSPREARVLLALAQELAGRYLGLDQMLDAESDRVAMGVRRPEALEPEMTNPLAAGAWELALLRASHHHPRVRQAAAAVVAATRAAGGDGKGKGGSVGGRDPLAALNEPEDVAQRGFGGIFTRMPRANPLHGLVRRAEREKKGRKDKVRLFFLQKIASPELLLDGDGGRLLQGVGVPVPSAPHTTENPSFRDLCREVRAHGRKLELCRELVGLRAAVAAYRKHQQRKGKGSAGGGEAAPAAVAAKRRKR